MRITHPFHPRAGEELEVVTLVHPWGEARVYYYNRHGNLTSLPARWTSAVGPDPVVSISAGRSPFRVQDLLELQRLMRGIAEGLPRESPGRGRGQASRK